MTAGRRHDSDFVERWDEAGAAPGEIRAIAEDSARTTGEPLDLRAAWQRIERDIDAGSPGTARGFSLRAATAGALALAAIASILVFVGRIQNTPPAATRLAEAAAPRAAETDPDLRDLAFPGGAIRLSRGAEMRRDGAGTYVLASGAAGIEVDPRPRGAAPLLFRAGDLSIEVVGTVFTLSLRGGRGEIYLYEGAVIARRRGEAPRRISAQDDAGSAAADAGVDVWARAAAARRIAADAELETYRTALSLLRAGQPASAADGFAAYLSRYPQGALRDEAELGELESLAGAGLSHRLAAAVERWLGAHPGHARAPEVRALLGAENLKPLPAPGNRRAEDEPYAPSH